MKIGVLLVVSLLSLVASPVRAVFCVYDGPDGRPKCEPLPELQPSEDASVRETECESRCSQVRGCGSWRVDGSCPTELDNPIRANSGGQIDIPVFIGKVISSALVVVGALTLLVLVYGGFLWLTSAGNEERVKKGSQTMLSAAIGLFIIFASYGILKLIITTLTKGS